MTKLKAVVDPNKSFESSVFGAEDLLRIFPELKVGGVPIEQDKDYPDLYYIVDEVRGIHVNDGAFFTTEEMAHLIVTDENGTVVQLSDEVFPDSAEIPGVIRRGSLVLTKDGHIGVVVGINLWGREYKDLDDEHHGTLIVWNRDEISHGGDNCEHYTLTNFHHLLTVLEY